MTIGKKMTLSLVAMLLVTLVLGISSLNSIGKLSDSFDHTVSSTARKLILSDTITDARSNMLAAQRGVVVFTFTKSETRVQMSHKQFESAAQRWADSVTEIRPLLVLQESKDLLNRLDANLRQWRAAMAEIEQLSAAGDPDGAMTLGL